MIKPVVIASVVALAGAPAMAEGLDGLYVNPEYNAGFSGASFAGSSLELHVGYEKGPWYIQAGPALANEAALNGACPARLVCLHLSARTSIFTPN